MKDQLIDVVVQRAGIDRGQAERAVDGILDFLKENPEKLSELAGNLNIGDVGERLGKLFGR